MKTVLPLTFLATPALAHSGPHLHPHGGEAWLALVVLACAGLFVWKRR